MSASSVSSGPTAIAAGPPVLVSTPSLSSSASSTLSHVSDLLDPLVLRLRRRELSGSSLVSLASLDCVRSILSKKKFQSTDELLDVVKLCGKLLTEAAPMELSIGNVIRRVLFVIRHEAAAVATNVDEKATSTAPDFTMSLHKLLDSTRSARDVEPLSPSQLPKLKPLLMEELSVLMEEIRNSKVGIAEQSIEHIHAKEIIMTFGVSRTVLAFLKEAAQLRKFEVYVAESAPSYSGQKMAVALSQCGIDTTVITDAAIFALMPAVNKVIIGTHAVMANGGIIAHTGAFNLALAAKHHSKPFVVLAGLHKLSPLFAFDQNTFNEQNAPSQIFAFESLTHSIKTDSSPSGTPIMSKAPSGPRPPLSKTFTVLPPSLSPSALSTMPSITNMPSLSHMPSVGLPMFQSMASPRVPTNIPSSPSSQSDSTEDLVQIDNPAYDYVTPDLVTLFITNDRGHAPSYVYRLLQEYYNPADYKL